MPLTIPFTPSDADQRFTISLVGTLYQLRAKWNIRDDSWYLDIRDETGEAILLGIRLVLGSEVGRRCADERYPAGRFEVIDTSGEDVEAGLDDFGEDRRVQVQFVSFAEIVELETGL